MLLALTKKLLGKHSCQRQDENMMFLQKRFSNDIFNSQQENLQFMSIFLPGKYINVNTESKFAVAPKIVIYLLEHTMRISLIRKLPQNLHTSSNISKKCIIVLINLQFYSDTLRWFIPFLKAQKKNRGLKISRVKRIRNDKIRQLMDIEGLITNDIQ